MSSLIKRVEDRLEWARDCEKAYRDMSKDPHNGKMAKKLRRKADYYRDLARELHMLIIGD